MTDETPKRKYNREKLKRQFTVRLKERRLYTVAKNRAESEGATVTDAVEQGLQLWLLKKDAALEPLMVPRFLYHVLPEDYQRLTEALFVWLMKEPVEQRQRIIRKAFRQLLEEEKTEFDTDTAAQEEFRQFAKQCYAQARARLLEEA